MMTFQNTKIALTELAYALEEVVLKPYQLTGYLEIDIRKLPVNTAFQYSISGLNVSYEAGNKRPSSVSKVSWSYFKSRRPAYETCSERNQSK
jgi:hypothetical protein